MGAFHQVPTRITTLSPSGLARMVASYKGNLLLFKFYLDNIWKLHQLPQWMRNPDTLQEVVDERVAAGDGGKGGFTLKLPRTVARSYNGEFDRLKSELRQLHAGERELISYRTTLLLLFRQSLSLIPYCSFCIFWGLVCSLEGFLDPNV